MFHFGISVHTNLTRIYCLLTKQLRAIAQNTRVLPASLYRSSSFFEKWDNLKQSRLRRNPSWHEDVKSCYRSSLPGCWRTQALLNGNWHESNARKLLFTINARTTTRGCSSCSSSAVLLLRQASFFASMGIRKLLRASNRETSAHLPLAHGQICGIEGASKDTFLILLKLALFGDTNFTSVGAF